MPYGDRCFGAVIGVAILTSLTACRKHEELSLVASLRNAATMDTTEVEWSVEDSLIPVAGVVQTFVSSRFARISKFPCQSCHTKPLKEMKSKDVQRAHWDIDLRHAPDGVMTCLTCHTETNLDVLHRMTGDSISFNASYTLCGQCHFRQLRDWEGGAHGKRMGGWKGPRVIMMCVQCHNPHRPAFDKRWPAIPSNLMDRIRTK